MRIAAKALAASLAAFGGPAAAQECQPLGQAIMAIAASAGPPRADVTDRLACNFPVGLAFNDAARRLEASGFDMLNKVEPAFHRWRVGAFGNEEFVSRLVIQERRTTVVISVVLHTVNKSVTRFAASYVSEPRGF